MSKVGGFTGVNSPIIYDGTNGANGVGTGDGQDAAVNFSDIFNEQMRNQALQMMMSRTTGSGSGTGGIGGMDAMLGGLGGLGGTGAMLGGMGGLGGVNGMMGSTFMPSITPGMENTLISAANEGDMSGAQLVLFMMIMMMQNGSGSTSEMAPIMQVLAQMLSQFSGDAAAGRPNNMLMLGDMQGETQTNVKRMVDAALEKVGYQERNRDGSTGNGNFTKFGAWYGMDGQPWCAMFVSWAADQAGILNSVVPKHASTARGVAAYQERDLYSTRQSGYIPREGDAIYFHGNGRIRHVGIVVAFDPQTNRVYTVEGNTNNAVRIRHYELNNTRIHGYGRNGGTSFGRIPGNSTEGAGANDR